MSLIITSSNQSQYGEETRIATTRTVAGIEAPSSYQNYFSSPIKIPANAEIALESIKIRRDALIDVENETLMYHYFGRLQDPADAPVYREERIEMPIAIRPRPGLYDINGWTTEIEKRLNESYHNPEIFGKFTVKALVNASGQTTGMSIQCVQRGTSVNKNLVDDSDTMLSTYWKCPYELSVGSVPNTDWQCVHVNTSGSVAEHKLFTRKIANASGETALQGLDTSKSSVIGAGHPFGLVEGKFKVNVTGSKDNSWRVGLSRPQLEYIRDTTKTGGPGRANLLPGTRHPEGGYDDGVAISTNYNMYNQVTGRYQKDYFDYMIQDDGVNVRIFQMSYDSAENMKKLVQSEVVYWGSGTAFPGEAGPLTKAAFNASYVSVKFQSVGDELELYFEDPADKATKILGTSISTVRNKSFLPIGESRNALFPRLNIGKKDDTLQIFNWHSHYDTLTGFRFPTFDKPTTTFTTGDDYYSNNRVARFDRAKQGGDDNKAVIQDTKDRPYCLSQTLTCDIKEFFHINQLGDARVSFYDGELGSNKGTNKRHAFIIGYIEPNTVNYYLEGKYSTTESSGRAKMNSVIGFSDKSFINETEGLADGYTVSATSGQDITFNSFAAPTYRVHSAFVRISNMPIQSYNGNKQSVSKMLYHLPRFTNDGSEYGDLFFAPGEKTYVSLHNPSSEILNNIEVQIVDVSEKPVSDISGNTICVFHMRQKK
jgi:hypothetical protein